MANEREGTRLQEQPTEQEGSWSLEGRRQDELIMHLEGVAWEHVESGARDHQKDPAV